MPTRSSTKGQQMRQRLAIEAARIMQEEGLRDFHAAKRKAAIRLDAAETRNMPSNQEIEQALIEYQRLFRGDTQPRRLRELRESALRAMQYFLRFEPRLVGPVLSGTADGDAEVSLHLFADTPEEIALFLIEENIPFDTGERRLRMANGEFAFYPAFRFVAGDTPIEVTVFPPTGLRQPPRSPVDGKPMRRANIHSVEELLRAPDGA